MTDEKKKALYRIERKIAELQATAHALGDSLTSKSSPMQSVVDDLHNLAASMLLQVKILREVKDDD